jgi:hypothetical protein
MIFSRQFEKYYNYTDSKTAFITVDVDWAPDSIVELLVEWFMIKNIPITLFFTHQSKLAKDLAENPNIEIGIHPDFSRNNNADECVKALKYIYPNAIGSRSHRNIDGRIVTDALARNGLKYHSNKLTWGLSHLEVMPVYNGMVEVPYFWEDGYHLELGVKLKKEELNLYTRGLKIFNIHPMLFFLNCINDNQRKLATNNINDLTASNNNDFTQYINKGEGISTFSKNIFLSLKSSGFEFLLLKEMMAHAYDQNHALK